MAEPGPDARDPSLGARFSDEQIARHGAYRRAAYAGLGLGLVVQVAALVVLTRGPFASVADALERSGTHWLLRHSLVAVLVLAVLLLVTMPLGYATALVVGMGVDRIQCAHSAGRVCMASRCCAAVQPL